MSEEKVPFNVRGPMKITPPEHPGRYLQVDAGFTMDTSEGVIEPPKGFEDELIKMMIDLSFKWGVGMSVFHKVKTTEEGMARLMRGIQDHGFEVEVVE